MAPTSVAVGSVLLYQTSPVSSFRSIINALSSVVSVIWKNLAMSSSAASPEMCTARAMNGANSTTDSPAPPSHSTDAGIQAGRDTATVPGSAPRRLIFPSASVVPEAGPATTTADSTGVPSGSRTRPRKILAFKHNVEHPVRALCDRHGLGHVTGRTHLEDRGGPIPFDVDRTVFGGRPHLAGADVHRCRRDRRPGVIEDPEGVGSCTTEQRPACPQCPNDGERHQQSELRSTRH